MVSAQPPSPWQSAVAAVLVGGPGATISHSTAAAVHRFPHLVHGWDVELTVVEPRHPRLPGAVVHRVSARLGTGAELVRGFPVTTPPRTLLDISNRLDPALLARLVDDGCISGLWTPDQLSRELERRRSSGRPRHRSLEALLAERSGLPAGESWLEQRAIRALAPYAPFEVQYQLVLDGQILILDVAWPRWQVAVEADGWGVRGRSRTKFDNDRRRSNLLAAHGWVVIHVTSAMGDDEIREAVSHVLPPGLRQ